MAASTTVSVTLIVLIIIQISFNDAFTVRQLAPENSSSTASVISAASRGSTGAASGTINDAGVTTLSRGTNLIANQLIEALRGITSVIDTFQHYTENTGQYLNRLRTSTLALSDGLLEAGTNAATTVLGEFGNRLVDRSRATTGSNSNLSFLTTRQLSSTKDGSADTKGNDEKSTKYNQNINMDKIWSNFNNWARTLTPVSDFTANSEANFSNLANALRTTLSQGSSDINDITKLTTDNVQNGLTDQQKNLFNGIPKDILQTALKTLPKTTTKNNNN